MEFRTPEKSLSRSFASSKLQGKPHEHGHPSEEVVINDDEKRLTSLVSRRTPLVMYSPNNSLISNHDLSFLSKREEREKMPLKRCFSKEALELSRHQIILTKESKAEISFFPPKRIRSNDFNFARSPLSRRHPRNRFSPSTRRTNESKRLKQSPSKLTLPPSADDTRKNKLGNREGKTAVKILSAKPTVTINRTGKRNISLFLVPLENFPWEEWRENNYNNALVRESILMSEAKTFPIILLRQDGQLVMKLHHASDVDFVVTRLARFVPRRNKSLLCHVLKYSFKLPFRVISGVIKWILGI